MLIQLGCVLCDYYLGNYVRWVDLSYCCTFVIFKLFIAMCACNARYAPQMTSYCVHITLRVIELH